MALAYIAGRLLRIDSSNGQFYMWFFPLLIYSSLFKKKLNLKWHIKPPIFFRLSIIAGSGHLIIFSSGYKSYGYRWSDFFHLNKTKSIEVTIATTWKKNQMRNFLKQIQNENIHIIFKKKKKSDACNHMPVTHFNSMVHSFF